MNMKKILNLLALAAVLGTSTACTDIFGHCTIR